MKRTISFLALLILAQSAIAQKTVAFTEKMKKDMCAKVKEATAHAWKGYKDYAWGADDLRPLTKTARNWYKQSMLMTPVATFLTVEDGDSIKPRA